MDAQARSLIEQMLTRIGTRIPRNRLEQNDYARKTFSHLSKSGGGVETIGELGCFRTPIAHLGNWTDDPWDGATYGIDASTIPDSEYTNGLILDVANAKLGISGIDADRTPEQAGTIKAVVYYDEDGTTIPNETINSEQNENLRGELVPYNADSDSTRNLSKAVSSVAQAFAEGEHARRMLDEIDGPLFLDGSIYPLGMLYWVLLAQTNERSPASSWSRPREIIENYIEVIDTQYERGLPVIGIVKTSTSPQLVDALEKKLVRNNVTDEDGLRPSVPWNRDNQLVAQVLDISDEVHENNSDSNNLAEFTYTSWFVSTELGAGQLSGELLEPFVEEIQFGEPKDYRRAFFYVRLPKEGFVFRIEVPLLFIYDEDIRHKIRDKALKEIAKRRDVPYAIKRADRIARITRGNRESLRDNIESIKPTMNYNTDGRWNQDDTSGLEPEND
jgi:hypothetical protein